MKSSGINSLYSMSTNQEETKQKEFTCRLNFATKPVSQRTSPRTKGRCETSSNTDSTIPIKESRRSLTWYRSSQRMPLSEPGVFKWNRTWWTSTVRSWESQLLSIQHLVSQSNSGNLWTEELNIFNLWRSTATRTNLTVRRQKLNGLSSIMSMTRTWRTTSSLLSGKYKALLESSFGMSLNTFRSRTTSNLERMDSNSRAKATTTSSSIIASVIPFLLEDHRILQLFSFLSHTPKISQESRSVLTHLDLLLNSCLNRKCNKASRN